jgi:zinc/manganese transport system substrate-binding protein
MKNFIRAISLLLVVGASLPANAALKVLATTPDWGSLTQELGGDKVNVYVATTALQDVHRVEAKPSLVARARSADLVVATGAELEVGWLPVLIQESGNANIQKGARGYFEAASALHLLEVPSQVDRAMGDIHPDGNPHVQLDPHNIQAVAHALTARLSQLDPSQAAYYAARAKDFDARWDAAMKTWEAKAAPLKGAQVVIMHRDQVYLCHWLGLA